MKIHFSVDDTIRCFRWLSKNCENVNSIFESTVLNFARNLHESYGIDVTFYCMFTDDDRFLLGNMPSKWRQEFYANSDWLKFGFHAYGPYSNYSQEDCRIEKHFDLVNEELKRFAGSGNITDILRLHYFAGDMDTVKYLANNGVNALLCADDKRGSYDLETCEEEQLYSNGIYKKDDIDMTYIPTNIRVENVDNIERIIESNINKEFVSIFTHEVWLDDQRILQTIKRLLDALTKTK